MDRTVNKKTKTTIVVISVALALIIAALIAVLIIRANRPQSDVSVLPENYIGTSAGAWNAPALYLGGNIKADPVTADVELALALNSSNPEENQSFSVDNMFPGDSVTQKYRIDISYNEKVSVLFTAEPHSGSELAAAMNIRLVYDLTGEVLYEGLIADMGESVKHELSHSAPGTDEVPYSVTVSLPTSAGNEFQGKELVLRFTWTVEDESQLIPPTGDSNPVLIYIIIAACALLLFWVLWGVIKKKRGEDE